MTFDEAVQAIEAAAPSVHWITAANGLPIPVFGYEVSETPPYADNQPLPPLLALASFDQVDRNTEAKLAERADFVMPNGRSAVHFVSTETSIEVRHAQCLHDAFHLPRSEFDLTFVAHDDDERPPSLFEKHWGLHRDEVLALAKHARTTLRQRYKHYLAQHGDAALIRQLMHFPASHRLSVYRFAVGSERRTQLVTSHPVLAADIANSAYLLAHVWQPRSAGTPTLRAAHEEITAMIDDGAPLHDICQQRRIPYWTRRIPMHPLMDTAHASQLHDLGFTADILNAMPRAPHQIAAWLGYLVKAAQTLTPSAPMTAAAERRLAQARHWMTNNAMKLADNDLDRDNRVTEALDFLAHPHNGLIADRLFQADRGAAADMLRDENGMIAPLPADAVIAPEFEPGMSAARLQEYIERWHNRLAKEQADGLPDFPAPPFPEQMLQDYRLIPITDGYELYMEGKVMHHCVATYAPRIIAGESFIYRFMRDDKHLATVEMATEFPLTMKQVSAHCNKALPSADLAVLHVILQAVAADLETDRAASGNASNRIA